MPASSKKTETMVGVFLFLGLGLLGAIILLFGNIGDFFRDRYEITVNFSEASGVIEGSSVRLRGAKIGQVARKPALEGGNQIQVILAINKDQRIEKGSSFRIETASLLGDKEIVVTPPVTPRQVYLEPGAVVEGGGPGGLERLQQDAQDIAVATRDVFKQAREALVKIEESVEEISIVAKKLATTMDKVNGQILADENLERLSGTLSNLESATASFARLGSDLEPVAGEVRGTIDEVRETNQLLQSAIRRVDPALELIPEVFRSVERTVQAAREALEKVQGREGALGALVGDTELKDDLKDFVKNLKEKGILRYKDEETEEDDPRDRFRGRRR